MSNDHESEDGLLRINDTRPEIVAALKELTDKFIGHKTLTVYTLDKPKREPEDIPRH